MKTVLIFVLITCFFTACATRGYQPVASLEELSSKEEIEKCKNWVTDSDAKKGAAFAAGFLGGLIIGLPIALAVASIPDEKNITLSEVADRAASKTYELPTKQLKTYWDSAGSWEYAVTGIPADQPADAAGLRPIGLLYLHDQDGEKKVYCEIRLVKTDEKGYWNWRFQVLKRNEGGALVYALNEKLKVKEPVLVQRDYNDRWVHFSFVDESAGGATVTKGEEEIFADVREHFSKNGFPMEVMKCAQGDKDCGRKERAEPDGNKETSQVSENAGGTL